MTEEEIRPIAEDYVEEYCLLPAGEYTDGSLVCAGIGTALIVSRQLEKQIQIDAEQIRALQKQNGELTDKVNELEQQIEKMKQCGNCGNGTIGNCEHCKRKPKQKSTDTTDYWRLKEIKEK